MEKREYKEIGWNNCVPVNMDLVMRDTNGNILDIEVGGEETRPVTHGNQEK